MGSRSREVQVSSHVVHVLRDIHSGAARYAWQLKCMRDLCSGAGRSTRQAHHRRPPHGTIAPLVLSTDTDPAQQAHALTALLPSLYAAPDAPVTAATPLRGSPPAFPFLTLLISGGHTLLLLATGPDAFRTLASTQDQAIGNAFDRSARLLGLAPGAHGFGSALEAFVADDAADGCDQGAGWAFAADAPRGPPEDAPAPDVPTFTVPLPRMMMFSYSGPHSAVDRYLRDRGGLENVGVRTRRAVAREFQRVAVAHLEEKVVRGLQMLREEGLEVRDVVVSGGVASNTYLRRQ